MRSTILAITLTLIIFFGGVIAGYTINTQDTINRCNQEWKEKTFYDDRMDNNINITHINIDPNMEEKR